MNAEQVQALIRPDLLRMQPYTPIVPFEVLSQRLGLPADQIIKLDANENPFGPSPRLAQALAEYPYYHIYPDPDHTVLRKALSNYIGVGEEHLLLGAGSDELLDVIVRLFIGPDRAAAIVNCPPTFGMYPFLAALSGAQVIDAPRRADLSLDVDGIIQVCRAQSPALLFIASPNNPDGSAIAAADLERLLALPLIVVVDQAYVEFGGEDFALWPTRHANLIVLRTFSKWAGLAGLRVGYGVFPLPIIEHLFKIKQPYNVNAAAQAAVLASLQDLEVLRARVRVLVSEREWLYERLQQIGYLRPFPSQANFILNRVSGRPARQLKLDLEQRGILVRHYSAPGLQDCIRVSVGRPEQNRRLVQVLEELA